MKKIFFIVNPVSGGYSKTFLPKIIQKEIDSNQFITEIIVPESLDEAEKILNILKNKQPEAIVAVGGDGTINLIAKHLVNSPIRLGIIPMGSGNGLARHLGIPMELKKSIQIINDFYSEEIDTGQVNSVPFFNIAGVGFDAHVAEKFQHSLKRGIMNYAKITIREFFRYNPRHYDIQSEKHQYSLNSPLVAVCLGSQFGNNAYISPQANIQDGYLSVTIVKKLKNIQKIRLLIKLFRKKLRNDESLIQFNGKAISIKCKNPEPVNIDGEPFHLSDQLKFNILPSSLHIIRPRR